MSWTVEDLREFDNYALVSEYVAKCKGYPTRESKPIRNELYRRMVDVEKARERLQMVFDSIRNWEEAGCKDFAVESAQRLSLRIEFLSEITGLRVNIVNGEVTVF